MTSSAHVIILSLFFFISIVKCTSATSSFFRDVGGDILGPSNSEFGAVVTMNDDGSVIAVTGYDTTNDITNDNYLHAFRVAVYKERDGAWIQVGNTIKGEQMSTHKDDALADISLSGDGDKLAIATVPSKIRENNLDSSAGLIKVYSLTNSTQDWDCIATAYEGDAGGGGKLLSLTVSLDHTGSRVAYGIPYHDSIDEIDFHVKSDIGRVVICDVNEDSGSCSTVGAPIDGEAEGDLTGGSVDLSRSGDCVGFGSPGSDSNGADSGSASVYCFESNRWLRRGSILVGEAAGDEYGFQVALTSDASFLAVSARSNDADGEKKDAGHVRVFRYESSGNAYIQIGDDIDGDRGDKNEDGLYYIGDNSGHSLALSDTVSGGAIRIAIGSPYNADAGGYYNGHVRLFEYNTVSSEARWDQVLHDIAGETSREEAGRGVAMSKDGMRIVVGSPLYCSEGNGYYRGVVRVYEETLYAAPSSSPSTSPTPSAMKFQINTSSPSKSPTASSMEFQLKSSSESPTPSAMKFQIKSSSYNSLCLSATFTNKLAARPCIKSIDNPLRKFQIWIIDNIGQLKLADMVDDLCAASVSRNLIVTPCPNAPDATMQFLLPDAEGPILQNKNGKKFVIGFDLNRGLSTTHVRLFQEKVSNPPSNVFSSLAHFNKWSIQEIVE